MRVKRAWIIILAGSLNRGNSARKTLHAIKQEAIVPDGINYSLGKTFPLKLRPRRGTTGRRVIVAIRANCFHWPLPEVTSRSRYYHPPRCTTCTMQNSISETVCSTGYNERWVYVLFANFPCLNTRRTKGVCVYVFWGFCRVLIPRWVLMCSSFVYNAQRCWPVLSKVLSCFLAKAANRLQCFKNYISRLFNLPLSSISKRTGKQ